MYASRRGLPRVIVVQHGFRGLLQLVGVGEFHRPARHRVGHRVLCQPHHQRFEATVPVRRQHLGVFGQRPGYLLRRRLHLPAVQGHAGACPQRDVQAAVANPARARGDRLLGGPPQPHRTV